MLARLDALRAAFPENGEIALADARAAVNIAGHAGEAGAWDRVDAMLARLDALRAAFPENGEIALEGAKAAFNIATDAGEAGAWDRVDAMRQRLERIIEIFRDNAAIAEVAAELAVVVHFFRRRAGHAMKLEATVAAARAAQACLVRSMEKKSLVPLALVVIKDARRSFPGNQDILAVYQWAVSAGVDFDQVPDL